MEYQAKTRSGKKLHIGAGGSEFTPSKIIVSRGGENSSCALVVDLGNPCYGLLGL